MQDLKYLKERLGLTDEECFELTKDCYKYIIGNWEKLYGNKVEWFKKVK